MLNPCTVSGAPGVGPFLRFGQRSVAVRAFMCPVTVSLCLEQLLGFLRTVSAVGEDLHASILHVQQGFQTLAVMHRGIGHDVLVNQLMALVHIDVVLVAKIALAIFLGPAGMGIFLAALGGLLFPVCRGLP